MGLGLGSGLGLGLDRCRAHGAERREPAEGGRVGSVQLEDLAAELAQAAERAGELEAGGRLARRLQPHGQRERVPAAAAVQPSALHLARRNRV